MLAAIQRHSTAHRRAGRRGGRKAVFPLDPLGYSLARQPKGGGALPAASTSRASPRAPGTTPARSRAAGASAAVGFVWGLTGCAGNYQRQHLHCQIASNGGRKGEETRWLKGGIYQRARTFPTRRSGWVMGGGCHPGFASSLFWERTWQHHWDAGMRHRSPVVGPPRIGAGMLRPLRGFFGRFARHSPV